jgi:hypothetical protein
MPFESNDRAHRLFDDDWLMENEHHLMALVPAGGPGRIRDRFLTLDGLVLCGVNRGLNASETAEYTHLFQHGAVESVGNDHLSRYVDENTQERSLLAYDFEEDVLQRIDHCLALQRSLGVEPPLLLTLAMLEVRGFQWRAVGRQLSHHAVHPFDRDTLMLRPVVMPEWPEGTARSVQPVFDSLANAAGWPRSPYFDKTGDRIRPLF